MRLPCSHLLTPSIPQHESLDLPSFSFLIEHSGSQRKILFDLGLRNDFSSHPPAVQNFLAESGWDLRVTKDIPDILKDGDILPNDIDAVIFSHHHFDHLGDLTQFPVTSRVVVGPGFKDAYLPGWPVNPEASLIDEEWKSHEIHEVCFDNGNKSISIGGFPAIDYFGDGSFFLLDSPGHTIGHLAALARVTLGSSSFDEHHRDKFVFMGGDICHYPGVLRPTERLPLDFKAQAALHTCPESFFLDIHPEKSCAKPYYKMPAHCTVDKEAADSTIEKLCAFDSSEDVLVIIGHDSSLIGNIAVFPNAINEWNQEMKNTRQWAFLRDFRTQPIGS